MVYGKIKRLIFEINDLNKRYDSYDALKVKKLEIPSFFADFVDLL